MPTTKTITLYTFDELSESVQNKVVDKMYEINVDYNWWENVYKDAERIGLEITEFDTYRHTIDGKLKEHLIDSINSVIAEHGESTDTYFLAKNYLNDYNEAYKKWLSQQDKEGYEHWSDDDWKAEFKYSEEADNMAINYRKNMLETYLVILNKEYEYLTSKESIVETIHINEYTFTEDGTLYS